MQKSALIVKNLSFSYDNNPILANISFTLNLTEKVGLIGKNGVGKTTLLNEILKNYNNKDFSISLLKQEIKKEDYKKTILDYIKQECGIKDLEDLIKEYENKLEQNIEVDLEEYGEILQQYMLKEGYEFDSKLEFILKGLRLKTNINTEVGSLSGGEKIKVLLSILLLSTSEVLLLDEPTNNLDEEAILFLENYLENSKKAMIIISHDEEFLNKIANKIFELKDGHILEYNMSYKEYLIQKDIEYTKNLKEYESAREQKKQLEQKIAETSTWAQKGVSGKKKSDNDKIAYNFSKERSKKTSSKISMLSKELKNLEVPFFEKKENLSFNIAYSDSKGNKDISLNGLVCGYDNFKTSSINLFIPYGTRLTIKGSNGSGKTTLIKTLLGDINSISGSVTIGNGVKIGYISQNTLEIDNNITVYEFLTADLEEINEPLIFSVLDRFYIKYEDRNKLYNILSPGERAKVNMAKLALKKINVLILDEVTNHLDVEAINIISQVIKEFEGTIINVSHNRMFNNVVNANIIFNIETNKLENEYEKTKKL